MTTQCINEVLNFLSAIIHIIKAVPSISDHTLLRDLEVMTSQNSEIIFLISICSYHYLQFVPLSSIFSTFIRQPLILPSKMSIITF